MHTALLLGAAALLIAMNAMFVAAEFAFVKARPTKLELLAEGGDQRARCALFGLNNLTGYLSVCQFGITMASLALGWLGEPAAAALLKPSLRALGLSDALMHTVSFVAGFTLITFAHVVFGEQAPKLISIRSAEAAALHLAYPMRFFYFLFLPGVKVLSAASDAAVRLTGGTAEAPGDAHSTDELKMLIAHSREEGQLDADEERFVNNIFNMDRRRARDVMVHRTRVHALSTDGTVAEAIGVIKARGHTRLPLYKGEDKDNIAGFLHAKDLLGQAGEKKLAGFVRRPLWLYDHLALDDALERMRRAKQQFALIMDEYGAYQGLLTMEDVLETIIGSIQDEFDHEEPEITRRADGSLLVDSAVSLDELKTAAGLDLGPESGEMYRTLAALLSDKFGDVPRAGDALELFGSLFTVVGVENHTIRKIEVRPLPAAGGERG